MEELSAAPTGGTRLEFHACLGRSSTGDAYRATLTRPGGVALQVHVLVLDSRVDPGSAAIARLQEESRALGAIRHPNVQPLLDIVRVDDRVGLVSEALEGQDLAALRPELPLRVLVEAIGEVASALDAAWSSASTTGAPLHLVHGDIRPGTIRVGQHGDVRVTEFGLARALAADKPGTAVGHWLYMAPERFSKTDERPAADVYSLGCVLYEGLCRRSPFEGMSFTELYPYMLDPLRAEAWLAEQLTQLPFETPGPIEALLGQMIGVRPELRPTAREVARTCDHLAEQIGGVPLKRWARERGWPPENDVPAPLVGKVILTGPAAGGAPRASAPPPPSPPIPSIAPPSMVTASMVPFARSSGPPAGATLLPFGEDPLDAPLPRTTPMPLRRRSGGDAPAIAHPAAPPERGQAPEAPPSGPPISPIAPRSMTPVPQVRAEAPPEPSPTTTGPFDRPAAGGPVQPLDSQLTGSWQRTLTPAPPRPRGLGPDTGSRRRDAVGRSLPGGVRRSDLPRDDEPSLGIGEHITTQPAPPRRALPGPSSALLIGVGAVLTFIVLALVAVGVFLRPTQAPAEVPATLDQVIQPNGTRVSAVPDPEPVAAPTPTPAPAPPPVAPRPQPAPVVAEETAPVKGNAKQLAKKGWNIVEKDPGAAEQLFRAALDQSSSSTDANYGLGYALLKQGQAPLARPYLCAALKGADLDTQREVTALLTRNALSCQ